MNNSQHFPPSNGRGHRRKKVVNQPLDHQFRLDPFEAHALVVIGELDRWMRGQQERAERRTKAQFDAMTEDWERGEPGA